MKVWVIESGEHEQRGICGVAYSLESAVKFIKNKYQTPYIVSWSEPKKQDYPSIVCWTLIGTFKDVPHYSTEHYAEYDITLWDVAE